MKMKPRYNLLRFMKTFFQSCFDSLLRFLRSYCLICQSSFIYQALVDKIPQNCQKATEESTHMSAFYSPSAPVLPSLYHDIIYGLVYLG